MKQIATFILALLLIAAAYAEDPAFPWKEGDKPPTILGVSLGMSQEKLGELLGEPSETHPLEEGSFAFSYPKNGLLVFWAKLDGVAIIEIQTSSAAELGGVRIGDSKETVLGRWGQPPIVEGGTAIYPAGAWGVILGLDETNHLNRLSVGFLTH